MKVRILSLILVIVTLVPTAVFTSCDNPTAYVNNVPVVDLCKTVDAKIANPEQLATMSDDYVKGIMFTDTSKFAEYAVKIRASGASIDEYAIFKAPDNSDPELIVETVNEYLKMRIDTWMPEYLAEEFPKLQNATVKVMGQYVIYCILDEETKTNVFSALEEALTEK